MPKEKGEHEISVRVVHMTGEEERGRGVLLAVPADRKRKNFQSSVLPKMENGGPRPTKASALRE